jgi:hypothetical protein
MKPDPSPLRQQQQQQQTAESELQAQHHSQARQEFHSVEEMIRFDLEQNPAPEKIAERLQESIAQEPPPRKSWWERLFGRSKST